jgi:hypothetical protein
VRHCVPAPPLPNIRLFIININIADPDPHFFGPPGSGSISQRGTGMDPDSDPDSDPSMT